MLIIMNGEGVDYQLLFQRKFIDMVDKLYKEQEAELEALKEIDRKQEKELAKLKKNVESTRGLIEAVKKSKAIMRSHKSWESRETQVCPEDILNEIKNVKIKTEAIKTEIKTESIKLEPKVESFAVRKASFRVKTEPKLEVFDPRFENVTVEVSRVVHDMIDVVTSHDGDLETYQKMEEKRKLKLEPKRTARKANWPRSTSTSSKVSSNVSNPSSIPSVTVKKKRVDKKDVDMDEIEIVTLD